MKTKDSDADRASPGAKSTLWIKSEPKLLREFKAACTLKGESAQGAINEFMRAFARDALSGFRTSDPT